MVRVHCSQDTLDALAGSLAGGQVGHGRIEICLQLDGQMQMLPLVWANCWYPFPAPRGESGSRVKSDLSASLLLRAAAL
jgi:hypothetical protein